MYLQSCEHYIWDMSIFLLFYVKQMFYMTSHQLFYSDRLKKKNNIMSTNAVGTDKSKVRLIPFKI